MQVDENGQHTITERGQQAAPAAIRRQFYVKPAGRLEWVEGEAAHLPNTTKQPAAAPVPSNSSWLIGRLGCCLASKCAAEPGVNTVWRGCNDSWTRPGSQILARDREGEGRV